MTTLGELRGLAKKYGKEYGREFVLWAQQNGILKNPYDIDRKALDTQIKNAGCKTHYEYQNICAQNAGFENKVDRRRGQIGSIPMEDNPYCSSYFGNFIAENYIIQTFENPIKMPYGNHGFDWLCNKGGKIDNKASCVRYYKGGSRWEFPIRHNNIADWFILSAWDNRDSLKPLYIWAFHKNDIVRGRKFWRRESFSITNTPEGLKAFEKYEVTDRLDKLKELCNKLKEE